MIVIRAERTEEGVRERSRSSEDEDDIGGSLLVSRIFSSGIDVPSHDASMNN